MTPNIMKKLNNILLVAPNHRRYVSNASTFNLYGLGTPHTGLTIIAQVLKARGYEVQIIDEKLSPVRRKDLEWADIVGISIQTITSIQGYKLSQKIRGMGKKTVIGGVHATLNPREALHYCDFVIRNEGDHALLELVEALNSPRPDLSKISGLSYMENGIQIHNPARPFIDDLDSLPFPDLRLVRRLGRSIRTLGNNFVYFTYLTRGCPHKCNFCSITETFGLKHRQRSPKNMIAEFKEIKKRSQGLIFFYDDNLMGDLDYAKEFLEELLIQDCVPAGWQSQMRLDVARDKELLDLMERTNCIFATFGFESINPSTLKYLDKGCTVKDIQNCIKVIHERNIFINGFFMLGSDTDTPQSINETLNFALENSLEMAAFMPLTPFPGTKMHQMLDEEGRIFSKNWELYDVQHVVYHPKNIPAYDLYMSLIKAYREFYAFKHLRRIRPRRVAGKVEKYWSIFPALWCLRGKHIMSKELRLNRDYINMLQAISGASNGKTVNRYPDERLMLRDGPLGYGVDRVHELN